MIRYSIEIRWSDEGNVFIASLPEFGQYAATHGDTYEEAVRNAQEVLELLIEVYEERGQPLPEPRTFASGLSETPSGISSEVLQAA